MCCPARNLCFFDVDLWFCDIADADCHLFSAVLPRQAGHLPRVPHGYPRGQARRDRGGAAGRHRCLVHIAHLSRCLPGRLAATLTGEMKPGMTVAWQVKERKAMSRSADYTLYVARNSYAMIAQAVLEEVGADYEVRWVEIFTDQPDRDLLAASPHARVPALVGPDGTICETGAIALYVAERHGESDLVIHPGSPERGRYLQWLHYMASTLQPDVMIQFHPELYFDDEAARQRFKTASGHRLAKVLGVIETALEPGPLFFGDKLTVCDYCLALQTVWPEVFATSIADYPNIARLTALVTNRPAVQKVLAMHGQSAIDPAAT